MNVPKGKTVYYRGKKYGPGKELPQDAEKLIKPEKVEKPVGRPANQDPSGKS